MEGLLTSGGILSIIILVVAVLALLMPFFILKIRNQVISINKKMDKIIQLLKETPVLQPAKVNKIPIESDTPEILDDDPDKSENRLIELIHKYYSKQDYKRCKFYCGKLIEKYPQSDYLDFAKGRKKELEKF